MDDQTGTTNLITVKTEITDTNAPSFTPSMTVQPQEGDTELDTSVKMGTE